MHITDMQGKLLVGTHLDPSKLGLITAYSHCDLPLGFQLAILNAFWFLQEQSDPLRFM